MKIRVKKMNKKKVNKIKIELIKLTPFRRGCQIYHSTWHESYKQDRVSRLVRASRRIIS